MFNVYQNSSNVYKILDILDEYDAKATFFLGGCWADDNVDLVREIYSRGNEVASHGYFHKDHTTLSYAQNVNEIEPSVRLVKMITGSDVKLFAPPSGAFDNNTLLACKYLNLKAIMWTRDTIDWRDNDSKLIYSRATENLKNGEFILMHPMDATVKALSDILTYIRDGGFSAVTVSYNLGE
jgi:peptidoglycan/xylan/chitin deacetylase (PgdA/CDA1 family)